MKKTAVCSAAVSLAVFFSTVAAAQPPGTLSGTASEKRGPIDKLGTGMWNIVSSPGEILDSVMENRTGTGMAAGLSNGLLEGVTRFVIKGVTGAVEVGTFLLPWPNNYRPILDETEGFKKE